MLRKKLLFCLLVAFATAQYAPQKENSAYGGQSSSNQQGVQSWPNYNGNQGQSPLIYNQNGYFDPNKKPTNSTLSPKVSAADSDSQNRVRIQLQLQSYKGDPFRLPPGNRACTCPPNSNCNQYGNPECKFGFMIVIASAYDSVKYNATQYLKLDGQGNLNTSGLEGQTFTQLRTVLLKSKPTAIDIFVHNIGPVLDAATATLLTVNDVHHVDTFAINLTDSLPTAGAYSGSSIDNNMVLKGLLFQTELRLNLAISCVGDLIGENCDLSCNTTAGNSAVCSNRRGFFSVCNTQNGQVTNCQDCPYGPSEEYGNNVCQKKDGSPMARAGGSLVDADYKTWTIVLGIISAILLFALICTIIYAIVAARRRNGQPDPGYYRSAMRNHEGQAERPLLQSPNENPTGRPPVAPMRMNPPSLAAQPQKSALRKGNYPPPAHYGGGDSVNETLNSSFASSVPIPPSRSADV